MLYLEDLNVGSEFSLGTVALSKAMLIEFAEKYDPQAFHVDEAVATKMFGGLIASGWQTASLCHRLVVDDFLNNVACMASPGVDELRWIKPVYANDQLTGKITIVNTRMSDTKPDRGLAQARLEMSNAREELVMSMIARVMVSRRPQDAD